MFPSQHSLQVTDNDCHFEWNIHNPFLPSGRRHKIRFEHETLNEYTLWEVGLLVTRQRLDNWESVFSVRCLRPDRDLFYVLAEELEIDIEVQNLVEKKLLCSERVINAVFGNHRVHEVRRSITPGRCHFNIVVFIRLGQPHSSYEQLEELSEDLRTLRNSSVYSDLCLHSNLADSGHRVHSSILRARWNNFFTKHPPDTIIDGTVRLDISDELLKDILDYMYTGSGKLGDREIPNAEYMAELNQVVQDYNLIHLRKNFTRAPNKYQYRTRNEVCSMEMAFPVAGPPFETCTRVWNETPIPNVRIFFQFQFCLRRDDFRFSYSLQFISPSKLFALVTIIYEKDARNVPPKHVHEKEQSLLFDEQLQRWTSGFEGDLDEFREFIVGRGRGSARGSFRFILYISSGLQTTDVETQREENLPIESKRLEVLSDHMFRLFEQRNSSIPGMRGDLKVKCLCDIRMTFDRCRREIFTTRVRRWRNVIRENILEGDPIPEVVGCDVMSTTFCHLLYFIYTGKVFSMSPNEMEEFANFGSNGQLGSEVFHYRNWLDIEYPP